MTYLPAYVPEPAHLTLERSVALRIPREEARKVAWAYLEQAGYRRDGDGEPFRFSRGAKVLTPLSFSPRRWHVEVIVALTPAAATLRFVVDTTGQLLSAGERSYWNLQVDRLAQSLEQGRPLPAPSAWGPFLVNLATAGLMLLFTAGGGAGGIALGERLGSDAWIAILGGAGGFGGMYLAWWIATKTMGQGAQIACGGRSGDGTMGPP